MTLANISCILKSMTGRKLRFCSGDIVCHWHIDHNLKKQHSLAVIVVHAIGTSWFVFEDGKLRKVSEMFIETL